MYEYKPPKYYCKDCGMEISFIGRCISCSMKSDYDRGYEAGRRKAKIADDPLYYLRCSECGQTSGHSLACSKNPIDFRSDYDKGFDAGYSKAKNKYGYLNGDNIYCI
jgi:predicted amidophosphoribosyltransferase